MGRKSKIELWKEKGFTLTSRASANKPAVRREDIDPDILDRTFDRATQRGDISQELRLQFYPSIEVDFEELYAGTMREPYREVERKLFEMGYRGNPTAYVEVTDKFGPDDGSYARQYITEDSELPYLDIPFPPAGFVRTYNRLKRQVHVTLYVEEPELIHILAHEESSAWLQPARHVSVSSGDGRIGVREFRDDYYDEFGEEITVLEEFIDDSGEVERPRLENLLL